MTLGWPLARNIIRGGIKNNSFGMVRNGGTRAHQGWDLEAPIGTPCFAVDDGRIEFVNDAGALGKTIALAFTFEGRTLYAIYAHLSAIEVADGQTIKRGQRLGLTGKSGNAIEMQGKQIHLHFEIRTSATPGLGLGGRIDPKDIFHA
ncbi:MAG: M23 family metallopeptidase, partial [Sphingomonadales bacterium]